MSTLKLEVGKTYIRRRAVSKRILGQKDLVKIVGEVPPDSFDYKLGCRFFGDDLILYSQHGECLDGRPYGKHNQIVEEFVNSHKTKYKEKIYIDRIRYRMEEGVDTKFYISDKHPDFRLQAGGLYINRMGYLILLDTLKEITLNKQTRFSTTSHYSSNRYSWNSRGSVCENNTPCMWDLLFQRR